MGAKSDYEDQRNARIYENKARLASLGVHRAISDLRSLTSVPKRMWTRVDRSNTPLRRSGRGQPQQEPPPDLEQIRLREKKNRHKFGFCCHICRKTKLCDEEDCKRCCNLDIDQPCMGKTDCSACHSSNGVFCRTCLRIRYGEDLWEVRGNAQWMCPHCIEEKGLNPYWICNSLLCLRKRKLTQKMSPISIIYRARKMGFKSAAHLIMEELQQVESTNAEEDIPLNVRCITKAT